MDIGYAFVLQEDCQNIAEARLKSLLPSTMKWALLPRYMNVGTDLLQRVGGGQFLLSQPRGHLGR
jgi:hypothetical protein